jgi:hypothetical protein
MVEAAGYFEILVPVLSFYTASLTDDNLYKSECIVTVCFSVKYFGVYCGRGTADMNLDYFELQFTSR